MSGGDLPPRGLARDVGYLPGWVGPRLRSSRSATSLRIASLVNAFSSALRSFCSSRFRAVLALPCRAESRLLRRWEDDGFARAWGGPSEVSYPP